VQSAVCADVARCGSGMSGMWPRGSRTLVHMTMGKPLYHYLYSSILSTTVEMLCAILKLLMSDRQTD